MNENETNPEPTTSSQPPATDAGSAPMQSDAAPSGESSDPGAQASPTANEGGDGAQAETGAPGEAGQRGGDQPGRGERRRKGKRDRGKGGGEGRQGGPGPQGGGGGHGHGQGGGHGPNIHRYVEDRIDIDAEQLARETRYITADRIRPLAFLTAQVRRLLASPDAHDRREARRSLVLFKSRVAFMAGRETGRERSGFVKVRDFMLRGIEQVTRDRETVDSLQVRNFLDQVDAFVGYHRFHCDDRRRD